MRFRLTKGGGYSNKREVRAAIPESEPAKSVANLEIDKYRQRVLLA